MKTLHINYTETGVPVADHLAESLILDVLDIDDDNVFLNISTENVLHASRYLKLTGKVDVVLDFTCEGVELEMDEMCRTKNWAPKFPSYHSKWMINIIQSHLNNTIE